MVTKLLDRAPRIFLYSLFLLFPVFLVPGISLPLDIHKQLLLAAVVFAVGVLWVVDILRKGEVNFRWHVLFVPLGLFVLVAFISAFGSGAFLHSFWGANAEPDSFFNIFLFALLFVLIVNQLTKKEYVQSAVTAFVAGAVFSALFLFANSLFSSTQPFGSPFAFAIYAGGALMVTLALILTGPASVSLRETSVGKSALVKILLAAILFLVLILASQWIAWAGIAAGSLLLIYFLAKRGEPVRGKLVLPIIILGLSLTFWFIGNPFDNILKLAPEVRLGRGATFSIAKDTVSSNIKNALFGSGPTTFRNQYNLFRSADINSSPFWNLSFTTGSGAITSFFTTNGVLGGGLILAFWIVFLWYAKPQWHPHPKKKESFASHISILLGGVYFFIAWLLYETNFLLLFAGFAMAGLFAALYGKDVKIVFAKSTPNMFRGMAGSVAALVVLVFGFYMLSRNYFAEVSYRQGTAYMDAKNYAAAISKFQKAAQINDFDKYWRKASQAIFLQTSAVYRDQSLPEEQRNAEVQRGITAAESAAILATQANPKNSVNFEQLGDFYTNVISISESAATMPFPAYLKAAALNPQSPYIPLKKARAHLANAKRFAAKDTDRAREAYVKAIEQARKEAGNALALKKDFADALEFLQGLPK